MGRVVSDLGAQPGGMGFGGGAQGRFPVDSEGIGQGRGCGQDMPQKFERCCQSLTPHLVQDGPEISEAGFCLSCSTLHSQCQAHGACLQQSGANAYPYLILKKSKEFFQTPGQVSCYSQEMGFIY